MNFVRWQLHGACAAVFAAFAILIAANAARAQTTYFDADGAIIGAVVGDARVGFNTPDKITVMADAGTNVSGNAFTHNNSVLNLTGGTITGKLMTEQNSVVNFTGGSVGTDIFAYNASIVNFSGGQVGISIFADNNSVVTYSGGTVGGALYVDAGGSLCLLGFDLRARLVDPYAGIYSKYSLSGVLRDDTDLTGTSLFVENAGSASFKIINTGAAPDVPEPGPIAFGLIAAVFVFGLIARKRKQIGAVQVHFRKG